MLPPQLPLRPPVRALWGRSPASVRAKGSESCAAGGDHRKEKQQQQQHLFLLTWRVLKTLFLSLFLESLKVGS